MSAKSGPERIWEQLGSVTGIWLRCQKAKSDEGEGETRDNTGQPHSMEFATREGHGALGKPADHTLTPAE